MDILARLITDTPGPTHVTNKNFRLFDISSPICNLQIEHRINTQSFHFDPFKSKKLKINSKLKDFFIKYQILVPNITERPFVVRELLPEFVEARPCRAADDAGAFVFEHGPEKNHEIRYKAEIKVLQRSDADNADGILRIMQMRLFCELYQRPCVGQTLFDLRLGLKTRLFQALTNPSKNCRL